MSLPPRVEPINTEDDDARSVAPSAQLNVLQRLIRRSKWPVHGVCAECKATIPSTAVFDATQELRAKYPGSSAEGASAYLDLRCEHCAHRTPFRRQTRVGMAILVCLLAMLPGATLCVLGLMSDEYATRQALIWPGLAAFVIGIVAASTVLGPLFTSFHPVTGMTDQEISRARTRSAKIYGILGGIILALTALRITMERAF